MAGRVVRTSDGRTVRIDEQEGEQADITARAKRVVTVDGSGDTISSNNPLPVKELGSGGTQISAPGLSKSYEDTDFVTGDSPVTLDVNADISRNGTDGYLINDGPGNFTVAFSDDGTNFGEEHTLKKRERINLKNLNIDKIRITWISDSAYRIAVI